MISRRRSQGRNTSSLTWSSSFIAKGGSLDEVKADLRVLNDRAPTSFIEYNDRLKELEKHLEVSPSTCERLDMKPVTPTWGRSKETAERLDMEALTPASVPRLSD